MQILQMHVLTGQKGEEEVFRFLFLKVLRDFRGSSHHLHLQEWRFEALELVLRGSNLGC